MRSSTAGRAATGRTGALPVLSGLRLELARRPADRHRHRPRSDDPTDVAVGGDSDGGVVLPARLAADIVRSMGAGKVEVAVDGDDVSITGGRSQFSVRPLSFDDYPQLADARPPTSVTLPAAAVGEALRQVVRAASTDEAGPILTGVLLTAENDGLRMVATDSYRLAVRDLADHAGAGRRIRRCSCRVGRSRAAAPGRRRRASSTMRLGERDATFEVGGTRLTTRLIEGEFPNYRQLIPASHPNTLTVEREPLLEAIRRVKILARDATPVRLQMGGDTLRLTADHPGRRQRVRGARRQRTRAPS